MCLMMNENIFMDIRNFPVPIDDNATVTNIGDGTITEYTNPDGLIICYSSCGSVIYTRIGEFNDVRINPDGSGLVYNQGSVVNYPPGTFKKIPLSPEEQQIKMQMLDVMNALFQANSLGEREIIRQQSKYIEQQSKEKFGEERMKRALGGSFFSLFR